MADTAARPADGTDLDDELKAYVEDLTTRYEAQGLAPDAARRAALVEVGGVQQVRELTREAWIGHALETVLRDVRHGMRQLRRAPGFAAVVIATLALVIGANATVFSVMHAVLWRPLPYPEAERLVVVDADARGVTNAGLSGGETQDLEAEPNLFDRVAHFSAVDANVTVDDEMERVWAASATDDMLDMLGAAPLASGEAVRASQHIGARRLCQRRRRQPCVVAAPSWRRPGRDRAAHRGQQPRRAGHRRDAS